MGPGVLWTLSGQGRAAVGCGLHQDPGQSHQMSDRPSLDLVNSGDTKDPDRGEGEVVV